MSEFLLRDSRAEWLIDEAGELIGPCGLPELLTLLEEGRLSGRQWLRHARTTRFALLGEVLFAQGLISKERFEEILPSNPLSRDQLQVPVTLEPPPSPGGSTSGVDWGRS